MALRASLLKGNVITHDQDVWFLLRGISSGNIIEGLQCQTNKITAGKAFLRWDRTWGEKPFIYVELETDLTIDTSWTKKVWIEIDQAKIDDGSTLNEDWTGIAVVNTGASYPASNYIPLASITAGVITDDRVWLKILNDKYIFTKYLRDLSDVYQFSTPTTKKFLVWDPINSKFNVSDIDTSDVPQPNTLVSSDWIVWESGTKGDYLFLEGKTSFALATNTQSIWEHYSNGRYAVRHIWNGVAMTTLNHALKKFVSPSSNLYLRIETDNAWAPSGTLFHANATSSIAPGSLTTSLADTVLTLAWSITIPEGTVVRLVFYMSSDGTYANTTINSTNFYGIGTDPTNTTTRINKCRNGTTWTDAYYKKELFPWTALDTTNRTQFGSMSISNGATMYGGRGGWMFAHGIKSKKDFTDSYFTIRWTLANAFSSNDFATVSAGIMIRFDNNNYIRLHSYTYSNYVWHAQAQIVQGGVSVYTADYWSGAWDFKIVYDKANNKIQFFYYSSWRVQIWTDQTFTFSGSYKAMYSGQITSSYSNGYTTLTNMYYTTFPYTTQYPTELSANSTTYYSALWLCDYLYSKTCPLFSYKMPDSTRVALANYTIGEKVKYETSWVSKSFTFPAQYTEDDNQTFNTSQSGQATAYGYRILVNQDCMLYAVNRNANVTGTRAVLKSDAGTILATGTFVWNQAPIAYKLLAWTYYRIEIDSAGSNYTAYYATWAQTYPQYGNLITYVGWSIGWANDTQALNVDSIVVNPIYPYQAFLSNTPGLVSSIVWTLKCLVWSIISTTALILTKKFINVPITVWASPFTWKNTTLNPIQYYVSWGTVNPIAISKDNTTFVTQSTATGYIWTLAPGDYLKVTYTVLPTITISDM